MPKNRLRAGKRAKVQHGLRTIVEDLVEKELLSFH